MKENYIEPSNDLSAAQFLRQLLNHVNLHSPIKPTKIDQYCARAVPTPDRNPKNPANPQKAGNRPIGVGPTRTHSELGS